MPHALPFAHLSLRAARKPAADRAATTDFQRDLLALQRRMWRHNERKIAELVVRPSAKLAAYARRYRRAVATAQGPSRFASLLWQASRSEVVFVGDYHPLPAARQGALRLLLALCTTGPWVLALEFFRRRDQAALDAFVAGRLSVEGLRQRTHYAGREAPGSATFASYLPLLEAARQHKVAILALEGNRPRTLAQRDAQAAELLCHTLVATPPCRVLVLAGQMHLAPEHLPRALAAALAKRGGQRGPLRQTVVYQNCEQLWFWALSKTRRGRPSEVLRLGPRSFALMHSSPVSCQLAYLAQLTDMGESVAQETARETFCAAVRRLSHFFGLPVPRHLTRLKICTAEDLRFLRRLGRRLRPEGLAHLHRQIADGDSVFVPEANLVYLANLAPGTVGEEATHYLRFCCSGQKLPKGAQNAVDIFYRHAFEEALGFVGSRVLHPERPAPCRRQLGRLARAGRPAERAVAQATLAHLRMQNGQKLAAKWAGGAIFPSSLDTLDAVAHLTGYHLGEQIFAALLGRELAQKDLLPLFNRRLDAPGSPLPAYLALLAWLQPRRSAYDRAPRGA